MIVESGLFKNFLTPHAQHTRKMNTKRTTIMLPDLTRLMRVSPPVERALRPEPDLAIQTQDEQTGAAQMLP